VTILRDGEVVVLARPHVRREKLVIVCTAGRWFESNSRN